MASRRRPRLGALDLARLNHVLIPATSEARDRARSGRLVRLAWPVIWLFTALSEEGRFLLVASTLIGLMSVEVQSTSVYLLWCVTFAPLVVSLLLRPAFSLVGRAELTVQGPGRVAVGDEARFVVVVSELTGRGYDAVRVRGPMLPWDGRFVGEPPDDVPLDPNGQARMIVSATFARRGPHHLDPFTAAAQLPPGLAQGRLVRSETCRLTVVPRLAIVTSLVTPRAERHQPGGVALASRTGEALELLGLRPYRPGDPVRDLHARSSARTGIPHVREYQQEYFSRFGVVLDTEAAIVTPATFEAAVSLAAGLVARLSRGEGLIDLLLCGDQVHSLTVGRGLGQLDQALDLLALAEPGPRLDPDAWMRRLEPFTARLSCLFVIWIAQDAPRQELSVRLRRQLPCREFLVTDPGTAAVAPVIAVDPSAIASGAPLRL